MNEAKKDDDPTPAAMHLFAGVNPRSPEGHLRSVLWDILGGMGAESIESAAQRVVRERDEARQEALRQGRRADVSTWSGVERELGVEGPNEALCKISEMWAVINAARGLVRWLEHPERNDPKQADTLRGFVEARHEDIKKTLVQLDGRLP